MLKLEIKIDEHKINREQKYSTDSIYQTLEQTFARYHYKLRKDCSSRIINSTEQSNVVVLFILQSVM